MDIKVLIVCGLVAAAFLVGGHSPSGPAGGDDMHATAAVALAGGALGEVGPAPAPGPAPGPKPPRKDCIYCKGTGKITNGDGHVTDCPHCQAPSTPDELFELQQKFTEIAEANAAPKKCCVDCTCKKCNCVYPGQCLVEANGGKPVHICDKETGECRIYSKPHSDETYEQPAPPVVDDAAKIKKLDDLRTTATKFYREKKYVLVFKYIQAMDDILYSMPSSPAVDTFYKECNKARRNTEKKITLLDKAEYDKFLSEYNSYVASEAKRVADNQATNDDSCSSGSCATSGEAMNEFWFREGSQNIWARQINSEGDCASGACSSCQ